MPRFTQDNTDGYDASELAQLNEAYEQIMADSYNPDDDHDSIGFQSWQDAIAARVLAEFDAKHRTNPQE